MEEAGIVALLKFPSSHRNGHKYQRHTATGTRLKAVPHSQ